MTSATTYQVPVTVTNTTGAALASPDWVLKYHWSLPDGTEISDASNQLQTPLGPDGTSLAPGASVTVTAQLKTPDTTTTANIGNIRTGYTLGWDLYKARPPHPWLSDAGTGLPQIPPLNQQTSV